MDKRSMLRNTFAVKEHHGSFYTAGHPVRPAADGKHVFCAYDENVNVVELHTGKIPFYLPGDGEQITAMDVHVGTNQIVFASQSQLIYHWKANENYQLLLSSGGREEGKLEPVPMELEPSFSRLPQDRSDTPANASGGALPQSSNLPWMLQKRWKAHLRPVVDMNIDSTGHFLATASVDGTVRVWDLDQGFCTHSFKGHEGLVSLVRFHPDPKRLQLVTSGQDCTVRVWDLVTKSCKVLESHMSVVTSMAFVSGGWELVTAGRDKVMSVWDLRKFELKKTIPVFESLESVIVAPSGIAACLDEGHRQEELVVTCGEKGQLKLWGCSSGECLAKEKDQVVPVGYQQLQSWVTDGEEKMLLVTEDSCFATYDASLPLAREKFVVGFYDEILGVRSVLDNKAILMNATTEKLLLFDRATFTCTPLVGHTDVVMAVDASSDGRLAASGGKDHTARIWDLETHECIAVCSGHTESIGAVAFSKKSQGFIVTGGADKTIKYWDVSPATNSKSGASSGAPLVCHASRTIKAHDKEINSVAIAPNDALVATGSQDRLVKVWDTESLSLKGTLKGHKRGVWCVNFSPVDKCVVSGSADKTIKIWSLSDYSCLRTLEGHTGSVLSTSFLTAGMQLLSSGSDGLLKLWTIRTSECVNTFEKHFDRVWATTVLGDGEEFLSAGADSILNIFEDVTETVAEEQEKQKEELILQEQELSNHLRAKEYRKAVRIALRLDQPFRIRSILEELFDSDDEETLSDIVQKLSMEDLSKCLAYIRDWNTNARHSLVAQAFFRCILRHVKPESIVSLPKSKELLLGLIPYTERHAARMDLLLQKSFLIDYTLHRMHQLTPQGLDGEDQPSLPSVIPARRNRSTATDTVMREALSSGGDYPEEMMTVMVTDEASSDDNDDSVSDNDSDGWEGKDAEGFGDWVVPDTPASASNPKQSSGKDDSVSNLKVSCSKKAKKAKKSPAKSLDDAAIEEVPSTKKERKEKRKRRQQLKRTAGDDSPFSPARKKTKK